MNLEQRVSKLFLALRMSLNVPVSLIQQSYNEVLITKVTPVLWFVLQCLLACSTTGEIPASEVGHPSSRAEIANWHSTGRTQPRHLETFDVRNFVFF